MEESFDKTIHAIKTAAEKVVSVYRSADIPVPQSVCDRIIQSMKTAVKSKLEYGHVMRAEDEADDGIRNSVSQMNEAVGDNEIEDIETQIPDGEQLFDQRLAAAPKITSRQINESEPVKQLVRLFKPPEPPASVQSSSKRSSRRHDISELEELDAEQNIPIDPFSQKEVQFAVKNKHCHHTYDKKSLEAYLKQSANPRCPNIGCGNKRKLTMADVNDDDETNALIQEKRGSATH